MKIKTSELTGAALDWAVAIAAKGHVNFSHFDSLRGVFIAGDGGCDFFNPTESWSDIGPLIERYFINIICEKTTTCCDWFSGINDFPYTIGADPLIAACRAIVASQLGDEVDVPEELL